MYIANRDGNVKEKKGFTCRGIYVWLTMDHVERECTYHVMSPSIHPFGLRETIREKGGERGRKGEKGGERGGKMHGIFPGSALGNGGGC